MIPILFCALNQMFNVIIRLGTGWFDAEFAEMPLEKMYRKKYVVTVAANGEKMKENR